MKWYRLTLSCLILVGIAGFIGLSGCSDDNQIKPVVENEFVGTATCVQCHEAIGAEVANSGHPHKLNPVIDGKRPQDHLLTLPDNPPNGLAWSDIAYVLGGFGWKVRFITGEEGNYQVVTGDAVQWNIPTKEWVGYHAGEEKPYDYSCFQCHTTGPDEATNTFNEPGVRCEACHGKGNLHAVDAAANPGNPDLSLIKVDPRAEMCGGCHNRGGIDVQAPVSGGFIRHHEQFNEMKSGGHQGLLCVQCHDEHVGIRKGQVGGIATQCESCHAGHDTIHPTHNGAPDCVDCHMPFASKSAVAFTPYKGDLRSHVFNIHVGPETKDAMWDTDGTLKRDYGVTLDFVCYQCHQDENGVGGDERPLTMEELSNYALRIHPGSDTNMYVGSATCGACHMEKLQDLRASGHPHKLNAVVGGQRPTDPLLTLPDNPPNGLAWSDIAYVLGGFGWKVRFIVGEEGNYQVVTGDAVQWNLPTGEWVAYHPGEEKPYNYDCFKCHTTGPDPETDTFHEPGVTCEACHGMGGKHVASRNPMDINVDTSGELCGNCHNRGGLDAPAPASGGFVRHHEQWNEMASAGHQNLDCILCHDPHVGIRKGQTGGIQRDCADCHYGYPDAIHAGEGVTLECESCHMPYAAKSAVAFTPYKADVRSHMFKLHVGPEGKDSMFENGALKVGYGATLDFACYSCHQDENGVGGDASQLTMEQLAAAAADAHAGGMKGLRASR